MHCRKHSYTACISVYVYMVSTTCTNVYVLKARELRRLVQQRVTLHATTPINSKKLLYDTHLHYVRFMYHYC